MWDFSICYFVERHLKLMWSFQSFKQYLFSIINGVEKLIQILLDQGLLVNIVYATPWFCRMANCGHRALLTKSQVCGPKVTYPGYILKEWRQILSPETLRHLTIMEQPQMKKELLSFLAWPTISTDFLNLLLFPQCCREQQCKMLMIQWSVVKQNNEK